MSLKKLRGTERLLSRFTPEHLSLQGERTVTILTAFRNLALAAICATIPAANAQEVGSFDTLRQRALELVNAARSKEGLSRLLLDQILNDAAQGHAEDMIARDFYAHVGPDGQTPFDRFRAAGGSQWALSGENIANCSGCTPPPDVDRVAAFHKGWMQSPEHRANILSEGFDRLGFGIAGQADEIYAVQTFAGPGEDGPSPELSAEEIRATALKEINTRRESEGHNPLDHSDPLNALAGRIIDARLSGEALPTDIFSLLPDGATGWTSISVRSGSKGGSGAVLSAEDIMSFIENWASAADSQTPFGGEAASHLGFAARLREDGRATAVAVFGGRR